MFKTKKEFVDFYNKLSPFEQRCLVHEFKEKAKRGEMLDLDVDPKDRMEADVFPVYFPKYPKKVSKKEQEELDKHWEDEQIKDLSLIDQDIDFQLENMHLGEEDEED